MSIKRLTKKQLMQYLQVQLKNFKRIKTFLAILVLILYSGWPFYRYKINIFGGI